MDKLKKIKAGCCLILLLLLGSNLLFAQDARFSVSVSNDVVGIGDPFQVTFSIKGNGERFGAPGFDGFQVVSGPNVSQSMTSINGSMMVSSSYSFVLVAAKLGTYTISQGTVVINNRRYVTNPITVKVVKDPPVQQQQQQQQYQNSQSQNAADAIDPESVPKDISKSLFLKSDANKTTVYQGEQLVLSYKLYTRAGIVDSRVDKLPDLNGFWSEDVKGPLQAQWRVETYKGIKYHVADVKQTILFAEHSGNITINPFEMTFIVRLPTAAPANDVLGQFFGSSYKDVKYSAKSTPLVIHVRPLPENGKPVGFTGAVGKFTIVTNLDKKELKANESLNYNVKITGSGNIKLLKDLSVNFPPDFEKYDPKITDTVTETSAGVSGSRIYNYLVIPRHHGDFTINPLSFSYFNPATGKYVVLSTPTFKIKVNKGIDEVNVTALSAANKQDVNLSDKDIRYIKTGNPNLSKTGDQFFGSLWYILLLLTGPVLCIAAFIYRNKDRENNLDQVKVRSRKAAKVVAKHLANAQQQLKANRTKEFYEAIFKGLYGYLSDKLNISMADLNKEAIASSLKSRSVDEQLINQLVATLDLCEMARFAPVQVSEQEVFDKAKSIINDIENGIK